MSLEFYKVLHLLGVFMILIPLGGIALHSMNGGTKAQNNHRMIIALTHGLGMTFSIVAGFGMLAKLGIHGLPGWAVAKLLIWLFFGASIALFYRLPKAVKVLWFVMIVLAACAAHLGINKPF